MGIYMRNPSSQIVLTFLIVRRMLCLLLIIKKMEGFYFYGLMSLNVEGNILDIIYLFFNYI
jgi:hypothetical protein